MPDTLKSPTLILHGWGGNKPAHWQEHLFAALKADDYPVYYPKMPEPGAPDLVAWLSQIEEELAKIADKSSLTVVAHSLGAISWMHTAFCATGRIADRVLLVAPPYVMPTMPPLDAPPGVGEFFPAPIAHSAIAMSANFTCVVASENDDYATYEQSATYASRLGVEIYKLEGAGHISPYWGYGEWPWVVSWCKRDAELPPVGKEKS